MNFKKFFIVDHALPVKDYIIFPFDVYLYSPFKRGYKLFMAANTPFDAGKVKVYQMLLDKGLKLAVKEGQKKVFYHALDITESELEKNINENLTENQKKNEEERIALDPTLVNKLENQKRALKEKDIPFQANEQAVLAFESDNFMPLIEQVRNEIILFPYTVSDSVSLSNELAQKLLIVDNHTNRIAAISYILARISGIEDIRALSDLFLASIFSQIGLTQINQTLCFTAISDQTEDQQKKIKKVSGLSQHMLRKSGLNLSQRTVKIIDEFTERADGSGYPNMKILDHIDPLAMILAISTHVIEIANGRINGRKNSIWKICECLETKSPLPGLEFQFGDKVISNIIYLLNKRENALDKAA